MNDLSVRKFYCWFTVLGLLVGAALGTRRLFAARTKSLRILFGVIVLVMAIQMIYKGLSGKI